MISEPRSGPQSRVLGFGIPPAEALHFRNQILEPIAFDGQRPPDAQVAPFDCYLHLDSGFQPRGFGSRFRQPQPEAIPPFCDFDLHR